ncbi:MAG: monovalent cation/H(+) antiporter subunit G [Dehalococcoidia bacterium]
MGDALVIAAAVVGTSFLVLAAVAAVRMPDPYIRLSAATKAVTFGTSVLLLGTAILFAGEGAMTRSLAGVVFFLVSAPVGAHVLARRAHRSGIRLWEHTIADELRRDEAAAEAVRNSRADGQQDGRA